MARVFSGKPSVFNAFTHERERSLAYLKLCLAEMLREGELIVHGFTSHLIPKTISHVLRVGSGGRSQIPYGGGILCRRQRPGARHPPAGGGCGRLGPGGVRHRRPWSPALYDILIPMDKTTPQDAAALILRHYRQDILQPTPASRQAVADFVLSSKVEEALAREGHNVLVEAEKAR